MSLPEGTLTFLLTDMEGSTRLWEHYPDLMGPATARQDALITAAIEAHDGLVVRSRGEGDSFFAVFRRATDAVAAASALQLALLKEPWPDPISVRVRVGIHTGEAQLRDGDYYGTAVNKCARLRAVAHGGQSLLSATTCHLVQDGLPADVTLRDLGFHRLKDLQRPEQVYQILHPALPTDFPPLNSLDTLPNNLPIQLTRFIGREAEIREVRERLATSALVTLTGAGGCGKTRLALQVAADVLSDYPDGVWMVDLAALGEPALVPQSVAAALGVREEPGRPLTEALRASLKSKRLLLLLDNCEHVVAACAILVGDLLRSCPGLRVLATSREILGVPSERSLRVPSLSLPGSRHLPPLEQLRGYEAVQLFVDRAVSSHAQFAVTPQNAPALAQLCRRLDGMPLALELAAARVNVLSVEQISARLDDRFRLLTSGSRTALPRQQTLRAAVDWSFELLSEAERVLLRRLSVFAGGFTLEAAEAVCADEADSYQLTVNSREGDPSSLSTVNCQLSTIEILDLLASLVDKSLVVAEEQGDESRYRLLETIRQYGAEKLKGSEEEAALRERHRDWFVALAQQAAPELHGPRQADWLRKLEAEHDNLRAALAACDENGAEAGLAMAGALSQFWHLRGYWSEGRQSLARALALAPEEPSPSRARALAAASLLAQRQGDYAASRALGEESLAIRRALNDREGIAATLNLLGSAAAQQGDFAGAQPLLEESLAIQRELGNRHGMANLLNNLGLIAAQQGDRKRARELWEESLALQRLLGDRHVMATLLGNLGTMAFHEAEYDTAANLFRESLTIQRDLGNQYPIAYLLNNLGSIARQKGETDEARLLYQESLAIRRELNDRRGIAVLLNNLGNLELDRGDAQAARALLKESLAIFRELDDKPAAAVCLVGFAQLASLEGQSERAAQLLGAAVALREGLGAPPAPDELAMIERLREAVLAALGEEAFATARAEGERLSLEEAAACVLEESDG
jgi:predicted ATPase/class 3 adenylate cyclase